MICKRNNLRLLTENEYNLFKEKYSLEYYNDEVLVKIKDCNRITSHPADNDFTLYSVGVRKMTFTKDALDIWKKYYNTKCYLLIDVQETINELCLCYQEITEEAVLKLLEKKGKSK